MSGGGTHECYRWCGANSSGHQNAPQSLYEGSDDRYVYTSQRLSRLRYPTHSQSLPTQFTQSCSLYGPHTGVVSQSIRSDRAIRSRSDPGIPGVGIRLTLSRIRHKPGHKARHKVTVRRPSVISLLLWVGLPPGHNGCTVTVVPKTLTLTPLPQAWARRRSVFVRPRRPRALSRAPASVASTLRPPA